MRSAEQQAWRRRVLINSQIERPLSTKALMAVYQMTMSDEVDHAFGKQLERLSKG